MGTIRNAASLRLLPIAAGVASLFGLPMHAALATTLQVMNCDDSGTDSLRDAISNANDNDTVDLSGLKCSTISLSSGEITIKVDSLTVQGPGASSLTIDGSKLPFGPTVGYDSRLFTHTGGGVLKIQDVTLLHGYSNHAGAGNPARGGCVASEGSVYLQSVDVEKCSAYSADDAATGGAIFAGGGYLKVVKTSVSGNSATAGGNNARGGGVWAKSDLVAIDSTVSGNMVSSKSYFVLGGGLYTKGDLTLDHSTVSGNSAMTTDGIAFGGGIWVNGHLNATNADVNTNTASSVTGYAFGGGVFANNQLTFQSSRLTGNSATSDNSTAYGGGADAASDFVMTYSSVEGNHASGGYSAIGGGLRLAGSVAIVNSTVADNTSSANFAGIMASSPTAGGKTFTLRNSTISGNQAQGKVGGLFVNSATINLFNSTIAFNTAVVGHTGAMPPFVLFSPGVELSAGITPLNVNLQSTLLSNNTYGTSENDLSTNDNFLHPITFNAGPANNFVRTTAVMDLPGDTLGSSCPLLGPLRDNGGLTRTHALLSGSVAIDAGNSGPLNPLTLLPYPHDQRGGAVVNGTVDYPREVGPYGDPNPPIADIGAYELHQDDVVFGASFDGCP